MKGKKTGGRQRIYEYGQELTCTDCDRKYEYKKPKGHTATRCNSCNVNRRRKTTKYLLIQQEGGRCVFCRYDKCLDALVFHHTDPSKKDFTFGKNWFRSLDVLKQELEKCILLCMNCHAEQHFKLNSKDKET